MRPEERRRLTWEDATERFLDVAELKPGERPKGWEEACDKLTWNAFNSISGARLCLAQDVLEESFCRPPSLTLCWSVLLKLSARAGRVALGLGETMSRPHSAALCEPLGAVHQTPLNVLHIVQQPGHASLAVWHIVRTLNSLSKDSWDEL